MELEGQHQLSMLSPDFVSWALQNKFQIMEHITQQRVPITDQLYNNLLSSNFGNAVYISLSANLDFEIHSYSTISFPKFSIIHTANQPS